MGQKCTNTAQRLYESRCEFVPQCSRRELFERPRRSHRSARESLTLRNIRVERSREAIDFHSVIGGQRYNSHFSGRKLAELGRIHYGMSWGRAQLAPGADTIQPDD